MKEQQKAEHRRAQSRLYPPQPDTQEAPTEIRRLSLRGGSNQDCASLSGPDEGASTSRNDVANVPDMNPCDDPPHQCEEVNRPLSTLDQEQDISEAQDPESVAEQQHRGGDHDAEQAAQLDSHSCGIGEPIQDTWTRRYIPSFEIPGHEAFIDPIEPATLTGRSGALQDIDEIEEIELEERRAMEPMPTGREIKPSEREPAIQSATSHINTHTDQTEDTIQQLPAQTHLQPIQGHQQQQLNMPQNPPKYSDGDRPSGPPCWEWCLCAPLKWCGQQVVGVWIYLQHNWFEPMYALLYLFD